MVYVCVSLSTLFSSRAITLQTRNTSDFSVTWTVKIVPPPRFKLLLFSCSSLADNFTYLCTIGRSSNPAASTTFVYFFFLILHYVSIAFVLRECLLLTVCCCIIFAPIAEGLVLLVYVLVGAHRLLVIVMHPSTL